MWGCSAVGSAPPWRGGGRGFGNNLIDCLRRDFTFKEEDKDGREI